MGKSSPVSVQYGTGTHTFPHNYKRQSFMLIAGTGTTTIAFGGGDPVPIDKYIEPFYVPISELVIVTTGDCYLLADQDTHDSVVTT